MPKRNNLTPAANPACPQENHRRPRKRPKKPKPRSDVSFSDLHYYPGQSRQAHTIPPPAAQKPTGRPQKPPDANFPLPQKTANDHRKNDAKKPPTRAIRQIRQGH